MMNRPSAHSAGELLRTALSCAVLCCAATGSVAADDRVAFVGVALDRETREADRRLQDYLRREAGIRFAPEELEYEQVINRLSDWDRQGGLVLARTTPYVQVASEMLGADMEVLATYVGADTGSTIYHSYFVVDREALPGDPTPAGVVSFIAESPERIRFIHHNLFSTSSFFLPSLHFRSNGIFDMPEATESLAAISVTKWQENSSSALVRAVARGEADLAAVWDGARARFVEGATDPEDLALGRRVAFIRLPPAIPNDLLVCSRSAPTELKDRIRSAIRAMPADEIAVGDFSRWVDIADASEARAALAHLRWLAREQAAPVTVDVRAATGARPATDAMVDAARHAIRLSETEFVLFDEDFHEHIDFVWTLSEIHDGAAKLRSSIPGTGIEDQIFPVSFRDPQDLTRRIVGLIQGRLHRIRYVWPYSSHQPIIIRDTTLAIPAGRQVPVQRITWLDQKRNSFRAGPVFPVLVRASSLFTYELDIEDFRISGGIAADLEPMSNVSYRVYQLRIVPPSLFFRIATGALIVLLVLAAGAAVIAVRRMPPPPGIADEETMVS